jgi:ribonucleoside-diphosphate reductase subunit M1
MEHVDPVAVTMKVISGVYAGVTTIQLDDLVGRYDFHAVPGPK